MIILDPHRNFNLSLAEHLGIKWADNAEIVSGAVLTDIWPADRKRVVLISWLPWISQKIDLSWADLVIFFTTEFLEREVAPNTPVAEQIYNQYNTVKYLMVAGGSEYYNVHIDDRYYLQNPEFFSKVVCANPVYHPNYSNKEKLFDVLLGTPKISRQYIYYRLLENNLVDNSLVSIHPPTTDWQIPESPMFTLFESIAGREIPNYESKEIAELEDDQVNRYKVVHEGQTFFKSFEISNKNLQNTQTLKELYNIEFVQPTSNVLPLHMFQAMPSQILPSKIYDASWFSLVSETHCHNINLLTEKTAKCLFGRRIFLLFGSQNQISILKSMGYKTFESLGMSDKFDEFEDLNLRWELAFQELLLLTKRNYRELYEQATDILEHNFRTITDLKASSTRLANFIRPHLARL